MLVQARANAAMDCVTIIRLLRCQLQIFKERGEPWRNE